MSIRGEIVIECDVKGCHAEQIATPTNLWWFGMAEWTYGRNWHYDPAHKTWICPPCQKEGKTAA